MSDEQPDVAFDDYQDRPDLDRRETVDDSGSSLPRSKLFKAAAWAVAISPLIVLGIVGLLGVAIHLAGVDVPRPLHVAGIATAITAPTAGRWVGGKARDWLWDPNWIYVVDLDARYQEGAIYRWPSQQFRELDVTEGSLDWLSPNLAVGKEVDREAGTMRGTWRGTLSDRELLKALSAVHECREQLQEDAKRGFAVETQAFGIVRRATQQVTRRIVSNFEDWTLPDEGESLTNEIESAIAQYGLRERLEQIDEDTPDEDDLNMKLDDLENMTPKEAPADD